MSSLFQRCFVAVVVTPLTLAAQQPAPPPAPPPPPPVDSVRPAESTAAHPLEPTADQQRYLRSLRTASRGVAQLRTGVDGVARAESSRDTMRLRRAGRLLAGLCGTARTFMAQGRPGMAPAVFEDSARIRARRLTLQVDSLIKAMPLCETNAAKTPTRAVGDLLARLRSYDAALQDFRTNVLGLPAPTAPAQP